MSFSTELDSFLHASKQKGASDEFLAALLVRRGWPADDVYAALARYWSDAAGVPVPQRMARGESARDAFLYLLSFITLATWAAALGTLLFQFVNRWVPDPLSPAWSWDSRSLITWNMASLAVAFPIYLLVMRAILREAARSPERLRSGVRKWLTYIALLVTAGALIGDLICFLGYFLLGELTLRFVLKAAVVMLICGAIFAYYLVSLRWEEAATLVRQRMRGAAYAAAATLAVAATFCTGLAVAGMPSQQRRVEADRRRVEDLRSIAGAIKLWHSRAATDKTTTPLPATLDELRAKQPGSPTRDAETGAAYEYRPTAATGYELCATFAFDDTADQRRYGYYVSDTWRHRKGRTCFAFDAAQAVPY